MIPRLTLSRSTRLTLNRVAHGHAFWIKSHERAQRISLQSEGQNPILVIHITKLDSQPTWTLLLWLPVTEQRLTESKSVDPQLGLCNNLRSKDYIDWDIQMMAYFVVSQYGSVRLAKLFGWVRVSRIGISMPMTSGTESSADFHISLSCVSSTTSTTKDNSIWTTWIYSSTAKSHIQRYISDVHIRTT